MKNKKQTILIILISVLIILGITAFVLATTINKTRWKNQRDITKNIHKRHISRLYMARWSSG